MEHEKERASEEEWIIKWDKVEKEKRKYGKIAYSLSCWYEKVNIAGFLFITIIITLRTCVYPDIRIYEFLRDPLELVQRRTSF
jgi:hypothetical protein